MRSDLPEASPRLCELVVPVKDILDDFYKNAWLCYAVLFLFSLLFCFFVDSFIFLSLVLINSVLRSFNF